MDSINITNARQNLFSITEQTIESHVPVTITTKNGNVVMMSEDDYNALQETVYLLSVPGMREALRNGMNESIDECVSPEDIGWDIE